MSPVWLLLEAGVVLAASGLAWRSLAGEASGAIEQLLGWGVMFFALVAGVGVALGAVGGLGWGGFVGVHAVMLAAGLLVRRHHLAADGRAGRTLVRAIFPDFKTDRVAFGAALLLGIFLVVTGVLAALAEPVVYDALTYRLSRIGHWLQEGRVAHFATNDPRQNYMPVVPDLVMAWLVSAFPEGYRGAALAQWGGGILLVLATAGLARLAGLGRAVALGAALLAVGTANVAPQFTTVHTDLLTAGLFTAAFYLWQKAALRGEGSWLAGIAGGLALGAKGTVFYLGPTMLLWVAWTAWRFRLPLAAWWRTLLSTTVAVVVFAVPGFVLNWRNYGGPLGPAEFVAMHHQAAAGQLLDKTGLNLGTSFVQVLEPNSQPPGLQAAARNLGRPLAGALPRQDAFSYENLSRRATLQTIIQRTEPDADVTSFGLLALALFIGGMGAAGRSSRPGSGAVRWWSAGVLIFWSFFHAMQQWHPYGFRYFILVAPFMAVIGAWGLEGWPQRLRRMAWGLALVATLGTAARVLTHTHQAGWPAVVQPERSRNFLVYREWRDWARQLGQPGEPWQLALPFNRPLAAFYRLQPAQRVQPQTESALAGLTAEQALDKLHGGWLIVPALQFLGNEGRVSGRVWLYEGDPESPFSLAAYHQLPVGAAEEPLVYRNKVSREADQIRHDLLVRAGSDGHVSFCLESPAGVRWRFVIATPTEVRRGEWAGGKSVQPLMLPAGQVAEVKVSLEPVAGETPSGEPPTLDIRR